MRDTAGMKLVFRIGDCGFSLPVEDLVEIRENSDGLVDSSSADADRSVLGGLFHRGETISIRDLGGRFRISEKGRNQGYAILILAGEDSLWGMVVDRVEGLYPQAEFSDVELPLLLASDHLPYRRLDRWQDELLVSCEARRLIASWDC